MSYNNYGQEGYGQSSAYGQPAGGRSGYGNFQPTSVSDNTHNHDVEMQHYDGQPTPSNRFLPDGNSDAILNECRQLDEGIASVEASLDRLQGVQRRALNDASPDNSASKQVDVMYSDITSQYRAYLERMKYLKSRPASTSPKNRPHMDRLERRLKALQNRYMGVENEYRRGMREQTERQYRIVRPDATEQEIQQTLDEPNQQVFSQALLQSDRHGQSRQVLSAVRDRHEAIQKIERQMVELAQLFTEMEAMVVQQDPQVTKIDELGMDIHDNVKGANTELGRATDKARDARKKKWICLGLSVAIVLIIIIIIVILVKVLHH